VSDEAKAEMKVRVLKGITGRIVGERRDAYYMDYSSGKDDVYICIPADAARALLKGVYAVSCRLQAISNTKEEYAKTLGDQARALLATLPEKAAAVIAVAEEQE